MTFEIKFTDDLVEGSTVGQAMLVGELTLGVTYENFESFIGFWSPRDYEQQWLEGVRRVLQGRDSCLITSLNDPDIADVCSWWLLYPIGKDVYMRDALFFPRKHRMKFATNDPYASIPARGPTNRDGYDVSEWVLPQSDFSDFLGRRS